MNYEPHQPPKTFKLPESIVVNKNVPSNITDLKSTDVWTMMLKKIEWLVFFASDETQICFQWDIIRKPFSKQVTKTGKKPLKSLTRHQQSQCHKSALTFEVIVPQSRNALEMIDENEKKRRELNRRVFLTILETAVFYTFRVGCARRWWRRI